MDTIIISNKRNIQKGLTIEICPAIYAVYCGAYSLNNKPDILTSKKNIFKIIKKLKDHGYKLI